MYVFEIFPLYPIECLENTIKCKSTYVPMIQKTGDQYGTKNIREDG